MSWNRGHSPPFQGGVAARLQEMAPFLEWRSRGGSYPTQTTPAAPWKGGEWRPRFQFIHNFYDGALLMKKGDSEQFRIEEIAHCPLFIPFSTQSKSSGRIGSSSSSLRFIASSNFPSTVFMRDASRVNAS